MELGPEDVSLLERCPHFRGCYVQASMELGPEDVSLLERCPHFRGCYVQASMELGPEDVSLLERCPHKICTSLFQLVSWPLSPKAPPPSSSPGCSLPLFRWLVSPDERLPSPDAGAAPDYSQMILITHELHNYLYMYMYKHIYTCTYMLTHNRRSRLFGSQALKNQHSVLMYWYC